MACLMSPSQVDVEVDSVASDDGAIELDEDLDAESDSEDEVDIEVETGASMMLMEVWIRTRIVKVVVEGRLWSREGGSCPPGQA